MPPATGAGNLAMPAAMVSALLPVARTASGRSSSSQALMLPALAMKGAFFGEDGGVSGVWSG